MLIAVVSEDKLTPEDESQRRFNEVARELGEALQLLRNERKAHGEELKKCDGQRMIYAILFWGLLGLIVLFELQKHYHMFAGEE